MYKKYFNQIAQIPFITMFTDVLDQMEQLLHCVQHIHGAGFTWGIDVDIDEFIVPNSHFLLDYRVYKMSQAFAVEMIMIRF